MTDDEPYIYECFNCGSEHECDGDLFDCRACGDEICVDCENDHGCTRKETVMDNKMRYDVVIYERATRTIDTIAGTNLPESGSFHTVGKRIETVWPRLNDAYGVCAVEAGKYAKGDRLPQPIET